MSKTKHILNHLEEYILTVFMAVIALVVFLQVVFRLLGQSLPWSEEFSRYLLVWITFVGASQGVKKASHVGVEAFTLILPIKARKIAGLLSVAISIFFCIIIIVFSLSIIQTQIANKQISPAMQIPMWIAYAALPTGVTLMAIRHIQVAVRSIQKFSDDAMITGLED